MERTQHFAGLWREFQGGRAIGWVDVSQVPMNQGMKKPQDSSGLWFRHDPEAVIILFRIRPFATQCGFHQRGFGSCGRR